MKKSAIVFLISLTIFSCQQIQKGKEKKINLSNNSIKTNQDTLLVDNKSAIFYVPDTLQIENIKKKIGEENFYTAADDYVFYDGLAHHFLDSLKMPIRNIIGPKVLKFIKKDKSYSSIRLDTVQEFWGLYFFDPTKKEVKVDMTDIKNEYAKYFNN